MATSSYPTIAVFAAKSKNRARDLALSLSALTHVKIVALTQPSSLVLARASSVLVVLDSNLDSNLKLIQRLVMWHRDAAIVVLGWSESEETLVKFAEAGACGYVPFDSSFREMLSIVQSARKGEFSCPLHITHSLCSRLATLFKTRNVDLLRAAGLTMRERQIVKLLADYLSNEEIAQRLCLAESTVKNHVHHILRKLGLRSRILVGRLPSNTTQATTGQLQQASCGGRYRLMHQP